MPDRGWKQFERRLCRDLGTQRIPVTGERDGADGRTSRFCFQFKLRRSLPVWLWTWLAGIVGTAAKTNRIGVLVLKRPRMRDEDALVVVRWRDWVDLHGTTSTER
jgi:hypothetical protein